MNKKYDVIVIGGGYVGLEVVFVILYKGYNIFLLIFNFKKLGMMLCNLLIGGLVKGIIIREIDVLGGM